MLVKLSPDLRRSPVLTNPDRDDDLRSPGNQLRADSNQSDHWRHKNGNVLEGKALRSVNFLWIQSLIVNNLQFFLLK